MAFGDHIRVYRTGYYHHGIDLGDGYIIHYTGEVGRKKNAAIKMTTMRTFLKGGQLEIINYDKCSSAHDVAQRARDRMGESNYSLLFNNCEHFAFYCKTGEMKSEQVKDTAATTGAAVGIGSVSTGAIAGVSAVGAVEGLSGAGIMSGLASIGGIVGSGAVGGVVTLTTAPSIVANIAVSKVLKDDRHLCKEERMARKVGRYAAKAGTAAGVGGTIATISAAGSVTGLSAAGITTGLAAIGSTVGGGMVVGLGICVAAPAVVTAACGFGVYKLWKKLKKK